ncbi:MAG: SMC family ATPase, partial [Actinomycetota bacterium]|nr:SMC family ATPase [Actinomycetota bacterium]
MRLHSLVLTAFGPFGGTECVDFDDLSSAGLFLLHGPTGAGKTTVLDAVCFALYGVVPGVRQRAARLRSDHADESARTTAVVLELTVRDRRLRVTRSPAWDRPKRRGGGTTREQARVLVEEFDGSAFRTVSTRLDESGQLLRDLLGMSAEQFCQVVLLPQGQFADFLRADAEARRPLLEQLFATERFFRIEAWLADQRRLAASEHETAREQIAHLAARVAEAARARTAPPGLSRDVALPWAEDLARVARDSSDSAHAR